MKSKIPILRPARTTGIRKTATAAALSARQRSAAAPTPTAQTPASRACRGPELSQLAARAGSTPNCEQGHYYLLNNYNPGYFGDGSNAYTDNNVANTPSPFRLRACATSATPCSKRTSPGSITAISGTQYLDRQIPAQLRNRRRQQRSVLQHLQPLPVLDLDHDQRRRPHRASQGHRPISTAISRTELCRRFPSSSPAAGWTAIRLLPSSISSKASSRRSWTACKSNPELWKSTAIFVTFDEGGGYYDSGYVQPLDYFGDGTRIPMIVVSPYTKAGHISHDYTDHVSIAEVHRTQLELQSADPSQPRQLPQSEIQQWGNPYVPVNSPAIGDLFDLFDFDHGTGTNASHDWRSRDGWIYDQVRGSVRVCEGFSKSSRERSRTQVADNDVRAPACRRYEKARPEVP